MIKAGQDFLKTMQWDESEGKSRDDAFYGGAGYGGNNSRPDLSNTAFFIEALRDTGLPADDPALQKALVFVSRCQNLKSEFNDQPWAGKVNDGGFVYTAANGGSSMAGKDADGGLRSYASMTYAGLKSMIYAGLTRDDPRVKAALDYITQHYTLDENPGPGPAGALLLLPHLRQDDGRARDADADRRRGRVARLARRAGRRPGEAPEARRELGQPGRPLHGRRPQPRHRLRAAGAGLRPAEGEELAQMRHEEDRRGRQDAQGECGLEPSRGPSGQLVAFRQERWRQVLRRG